MMAKPYINNECTLFINLSFNTKTISISTFLMNSSLCPPDSCNHNAFCDPYTDCCFCTESQKGKMLSL